MRYSKKSSSWLVAGHWVPGPAAQQPVTAAKNRWCAEFAAGHVLQPSSCDGRVLVATWTRPGSYWDVFSQPGSYTWLAAAALVATRPRPGSSLTAALLHG
jgi:hypothetical protein